LIGTQINFASTAPDCVTWLQKPRIQPDCNWFVSPVLNLLPYLLTLIACCSFEAIQKQLLYVLCSREPTGGCT
jgi:hypothetical protein